MPEPIKHYMAQPIATAPKDGSVIMVACSARWHPYKPASEQYKNGTKGRWQKFNGFGWENYDGAPEEWLAPLEAEAS